MNETFIRALDMLEALAAKAGTTVEQMYPLWVKQAWVEGIVGLVAMSIVILVGATVAILVALNAKDLGDGGDPTGPYLLSGGVTIILLVVIAGTLAVNVPKILNPGYYGAKDLILTIQGVTD